jgi:uncharacterized membrane-anchored protein
MKSLAASPTYARDAARNVPGITAIFWIISLLSTARGESTSDYLVYQINPYVAVMVGCLGLIIGCVCYLTVALRDLPGDGQRLSLQ